MPPDDQLRSIGQNIPDIGSPEAEVGYVFQEISIHHDVYSNCYENYFVRAASKKLWEEKIK